jgi:DNA-binding IclR family transcriptional regulator
MSVSTVRSLEKGIDLILLFSQRGPMLSLPEIAAALRLPESTAYRLITTLQRKLIIGRDPITKKYTLGAQLLCLQDAVLAHSDIPRLALSHLEELASESEETAILYLLQGHHIVLAESVNSPKTVRFVPAKGTPIPLHAPAGGRAILAFMSEEFLESYLREYGLKRFTEDTIVDRRIFRRLLSRIRLQGFAITSNQFHADTTGIAAPVYNYRRNEAIGSLTVAGPNSRFTEEKAKGLAPMVCKHAAELSVTLGAVEEGGSSEGPRKSRRRVQASSAR